MKDLMKPKKFDFLTVSVKNFIVAGSKDQPKNSLALKLGTSLRQMAERLRGTYLRNSDDPSSDRGRKETEDFLELMKMEWTNTVSTQCLKRMYDYKMNRQQGIYKPVGSLSLIIAYSVYFSDMSVVSSKQYLMTVSEIVVIKACP